MRQINAGANFNATILPTNYISKIQGGVNCNAAQHNLALPAGQSAWHQYNLICKRLVKLTPSAAVVCRSLRDKFQGSRLSLWRIVAGSSLISGHSSLHQQGRKKMFADF
jgi:hypothetical protein